MRVLQKRGRDLEADGVAVCAQYRAERDDCVVFSLPLEDTEPDGPMLRRAIELAANGGGTDGFFLGLKEGMFMLSAVLPLGGLSAEEFGRRLIALGAAQYAKDHLPGFPVEQLSGDGEDAPGMTAMKLDEVHSRVLLACMFDDEGKPDMAHLTERLGRFTENDIQTLTRRTTPTPGTSSTGGEAPGGAHAEAQRGRGAERGALTGDAGRMPRKRRGRFSTTIARLPRRFPPTRSRGSATLPLRSPRGGTRFRATCGGKPPGSCGKTQPAPGRVTFRLHGCRQGERNERHGQYPFFWNAISPDAAKEADLVMCLACTQTGKEPEP